MYITYTFLKKKKLNCFFYYFRCQVLQTSFTAALTALEEYNKKTDTVFQRNVGPSYQSFLEEHQVTMITMQQMQMNVLLPSKTK